MPEDNSDILPDMTWKQRLKDVREARGLSKSELARRVHVTPATTTDWEGDKVKMIDGANLIKLAEVLEVAPEWLITGRGPGVEESLVIGMFTKTYMMANEKWRTYLKTPIEAAQQGLKAAQPATEETKAIRKNT